MFTSVYSPCAGISIVVNNLASFLLLFTSIVYSVNMKNKPEIMFSH